MTESKKIKYVFLIPLMFVSVLLGYSCNEDSLGIEKNVIITPLDTTKQDTLKPIVTKVGGIIDSIYFVEEFTYDAERSYFPLKIEVNRTVSFAIVDTGTFPPAVWVDLRIENTNPDWIYKDQFSRQFYSSIVQIRLDSFPSEGSYRLNGSASSGFWSEIMTKKVTSGDSTFLSGTDTNFEIVFTKAGKKTIKAKTTARIQDATDPSKDVYLNGSFIIVYP
jgi:hypothetical protein